MRLPNKVELRESCYNCPHRHFILPQLSITDIPTPTVTTVSIDSLLEVAKITALDYKVALLQSTQQEHNLTYQKALQNQCKRRISLWSSGKLCK